MLPAQLENAEVGAQNQKTSLLVPAGNAEMEVPASVRLHGSSFRVKGRGLGDLSFISVLSIVAESLQASIRRKAVWARFVARRQTMCACPPPRFSILI